MDLQQNLENSNPDLSKYSLIRKNLGTLDSEKGPINFAHFNNYK